MRCEYKRRVLCSLLELHQLQSIMVCARSVLRCAFFNVAAGTVWFAIFLAKDQYILLKEHSRCRRAKDLRDDINFSKVTSDETITLLLLVSWQVYDRL